MSLSKKFTVHITTFALELSLYFPSKSHSALVVSSVSFLPLRYAVFLIGAFCQHIARMTLEVVLQHTAYTIVIRCYTGHTSVHPRRDIKSSAISCIRFLAASVCVQYSAISFNNPLAHQRSSHTDMVRLNGGIRFFVLSFGLGFMAGRRTPWPALIITFISSGETFSTQPLSFFITTSYRTSNVLSSWVLDYHSCAEHGMTCVAFVRFRLSIFINWIIKLTFLTLPVLGSLT